MRFDEFDLEYDLLDGLDAMNFREATPVQEQTIPVILTGRDIIACAQTGTGKTAAFVLPLLNQLVKKTTSGSKIRALIMAPTRELAQQIDVQIQGFSYFLPISSLLVYGGGDGKDWEQQKRGMKMGADILVATPGRLLSHLEHSTIDLSQVEHFILDEADRMLDMGFNDDIVKIVKHLPEKRQTILFSATMPPKIRNLIKTTLHNPVEVSVAISKPNESITQGVYICYDGQKQDIVEHLFAEKREGKSIIFASSKLKVKDLAQRLKRKKMRVAAMHSDLTQEERQSVMLDFNNNRLDMLVATDIISRGIDINSIGLVINYDVPRDAEDYIHRIGRTGRAEATGEAITLVGEKEHQKWMRIEKLIERKVNRLPIPTELGESPAFNSSNSGGLDKNSTEKGGSPRNGSGKKSTKGATKGANRGADKTRAKESSNQSEEEQKREPLVIKKLVKPAPVDQSNSADDTASK